jgi:SAM-dependent methyltransferase
MVSNFPMRLARAGRSIFTLNRDREYAALKRMLHLNPSDALLDVGCGDGFWTSRMAKRCGSVVGIEPNRKTLEWARALHSGPNINYVCGIAECLPFGDQSFDKIFSVSCLEHFADPWRGLSEIARVLRPGGRLALSVDSLLPDNTSPSFGAWHKNRHFVTHYFSHDTLISALETAGFSCEPESVHLLRSRVAASLRQAFIRRPRLWLPLFPAFYLLVRVTDRLFNDMHGQIIVVAVSR